MAISVEKLRKSASRMEELAEGQKDSPGISPDIQRGVEIGLEGIGLDEMGEVSEQEGDVSDGDLGGSKQVTGGQAIVDAREELLKNLPSQRMMILQIRKEIRKEIDVLNGKCKKILRSSKNPNYSEINNLVRKIRELKGILFALLRGSVDSLKALWLRYVHKIG
jgi:hypothetical protein